MNHPVPFYSCEPLPRLSGWAPHWRPGGASATIKPSIEPSRTRSGPVNAGQLSRRDWLSGVPAALGVGLTAGAIRPATAHADDEAPAPFGFCLNTSTLMGQKLPLAEELEIAAKAGYRAVEPWIRELQAHTESGGSLDDLGKKARDLGLTVESAIGFFEWAVDDDGRRQKALDQAAREMEMVAKIGGKRIAAPPAGATDRSDSDPRRLADRYRELLRRGDATGVVPQVEVWGFSKTLGRLGEAAYVAIESGHRHACILPDIFHLYKGGSGFDGLALLGPRSMHVFHLNDYPDSPPRTEIDDARRVYPGDGVAPLGEVVRTLRDVGFRGVLSLELFNRDYWKQDALTVARTGLEKMKAVVRRALV